MSDTEPPGPHAAREVAWLCAYARSCDGDAAFWLRRAAADRLIGTPRDREHSLEHARSEAREAGTYLGLAYRAAGL